MNLDYLNFDLKAPYGTPTGTPKANRKNSQQNPPHINPFPSSSKVLIYLINSSSVDWILKWESLWLISFIPVFLNISRDSVGFIRFFIGLILAFLKISCAILKLNLSISKISTRYSWHSRRLYIIKTVSIPFHFPLMFIGIRNILTLCQDLEGILRRNENSNTKFFNLT